MSMKTLPLIALAFSILCASAVFADDPIVDRGGTEDGRAVRAIFFTLEEASELTLTVGVESIREGGAPSLRVQIFTVDEEGRESEIRRYRVTLTSNTPLTAGDMQLEPGRYKLGYVVDRADYVVKLEHKAD